MITLHTNIFEIENLADLSSDYRLYRIRGLSPDHPQFHQNRQALIKRLSFQLKTPVTTIKQGDQLCLVVKSDSPEPPAECDLVRMPVRLDPMPGVLTLNYRKRSPESDAIALRFLQFLVQAPLRNNPHLWQPKAGAPFYEKVPEHETRRVSIYRGFLVRATLTPSGGLGFFVDLRHRYVARLPLSSKINRQEFVRRYRGRNFVYRYGHRWFDVQLTDFSDLNAQEFTLKTAEGETVCLFEWVQAQCTRPLPDEVSRMPMDSAVVHYFTALKETRAAPTPLCHQVLDTNHEWVQQEHGRTLPPPHARLGMIKDFVKKRMHNLRFGKATLRLSQSPLPAPEQYFRLPDYEFGSKRILSVRKTPGAQQTRLEDVGKARAALLSDRQVGFYKQRPLDRQFFFMPRSVHETWGQQFLQDLRRRVDTLFPQRHRYDPEIITYDDCHGRTFVEQATALLEAAQAAGHRDGYAVVMVHRPTDQRVREHDQLAAMAIRKLRDIGIFAAVMHTEFGERAYAQKIEEGQVEYAPRDTSRIALRGYLQAVAVNKVLLTSERWPFVLATPLHADVILGVDVKDHCAGFTVVADGGRHIATVNRESRQKEKLNTKQFRDHMLDIVRKVARVSTRLIRVVAIHRDGILFDSERIGAQQALETLKAEKVVTEDATLTCVEIPKESVATLRLFEIEQQADGRTGIFNPILGTYFFVDAVNGYVCTTGWPFLRNGTAKPLHIRKLFGSLSLQECLEDIFFLSALAWTRPDNCARDPITVKLNDRRLAEDASEFDEDELDTALQSASLAPLS